MDKRNKLNCLEGKEWIQETKSIWYQKGLGSSHPHAQIEKQHPAPFSFQDISRLINFFTKPDQLVLDPFVGVASTLKACALLERKGIGIELSEKWRNLGLERLKIEVNEESLQTQDILLGDCREILQTFPDNHFDFIVTSPPYWNILSKKADHKVKQERLANNLATKYSDNVLDIGNLPSYKEFLDELVKIFFMCNRVLKLNKYIAIVVSDFRHQSNFIPFHSDLVSSLSNIFKLQGIKVLAQNSKKLYPYGYPFAYVENIHHQYILILKKV